MSDMLHGIEKRIDNAKAKAKEKKAEHDLKQARKEAEKRNQDSSALF